MLNKEHAVTLEGVFREWGLDSHVMQTGNGLWAVTIKRDDGRIVSMNDDAAGLYASEEDFWDGREAQVIPLA